MKKEKSKKDMAKLKKAIRKVFKEATRNRSH